MRIDEFTKTNKVKSVVMHFAETVSSIMRATREHAMAVVAWLRNVHKQNSIANNPNQLVVLTPQSRTAFMQITAGYLTVALGVIAMFVLAATILLAGDEEIRETKSIATTSEKRGDFRKSATVADVQEAAEGPADVQEVQASRKLSANDPETVHEADRLLSHPVDPRRKAAGVAMSKINFTRALPEVLKSLQQYQDSPRFTYQLGRAYEAAGDLEQALEAYHKAAKLGYPMAFYNLALHYQEGKAVAADTEKSKKYCQMAVAGGIESAKELLLHYEFDAAGFSDPKLFRSIYTKTLDLSTHDQEELAATLQPFLETFFQSKDCPAPVSRSAYMRVSKIMTQQALKNVFVPRVTPGRTRNVTFGMVDKLRLGRQDAQLFYNRYGCESEVARQFFTNVEYYIQRLE